MSTYETTTSRWAAATALLLVCGLAIMTSPLWSQPARGGAQSAPTDAPHGEDRAPTLTTEAVTDEPRSGNDLAVSRAGDPQRLPGRVRYAVTVANLGQGDAPGLTASYRCLDRHAPSQPAAPTNESALGPLAPGQSTTYIIDCPYSFWAPTEALHLTVVAGDEPLMATSSIEIGMFD